MSKKEKLEAKLLNRTIEAEELRTLLGLHGWAVLRQTGSHQIWGKDGNIYNLSAHGKDLKPYQIKQAKIALGLE